MVCLSEDMPCCRGDIQQIMLCDRFFKPVLTAVYAVFVAQPIDKNGNDPVFTRPRQVLSRISARPG
jgi:hypothetical protein